MKDFIINISKVLVSNQDKIPYIKTFKKGVLPPRPAFGAISVLPQRVGFNYQFSNGQYKATYEVLIEVYLKGLNLDKIKKALREAIDQISAIATENFTFNDYVYDSYITSASFSDPLSIEDSIVQMASMTLYGIKKLQKPSDRSVSSSIKFSSETEVIEKIKEQIIKYRNNPDYNINRLNNLKLYTVDTSIKFPLVLVTGTLTNEKIRAFTGMDINIGEFNLIVFTKLIDKDYSLYTNLDIANGLRDILFLAGDFDGALLDSEVSSIDYFRTLDPQLGLVYSTIINLNGGIYKKVNNTF